MRHGAPPHPPPEDVRLWRPRQVDGPSAIRGHARYGHGPRRVDHGVVDPAPPEELATARGVSQVVPDRLVVGGIPVLLEGGDVAWAADHEAEHVRLARREADRGRRVGLAGCSQHLDGKGPETL